MAEATFAHVVSQRKLDGEISVDSCGTASYHIGEEPDERTVATCKKHGVPINSQARQIEKEDFHKFDYILGSECVWASDALRHILSSRRSDDDIADSFRTPQWMIRT
jgi:protein-tyrosine-phosphatase